MTKSKSWTPKDGQRYWYVFLDAELHVDHETYREEKLDWWSSPQLMLGNCFRTKKEAQKAAERINKILKEDKL